MLSVDTNALRATQPQFADTARRVVDAAATLQGVLEAEGECWGGDEVGQKFADGYASDAVEGLQAGNKLGSVLDSFGAAMIVVADTIEAQDEATARAINGVDI